MQQSMDNVDLRSASLMDADDVALLLSALGYPCEREDAGERIQPSSPTTGRRWCWPAMTASSAG